MAAPFRTGTKLFTKLKAVPLTGKKIPSRRCFCSTKTPTQRVPESTSVKTSTALNNSEDSCSKFSWYSQHAPQFLIKGEQVQVISEPSEFYEILKLKTRKAKHRITLASLYLGTSHLEKELISCIREACLSAEKSDRDFEVNVLLDYTRGSRGKVNSQTMLLPLCEEFHNVHVSFYHTPDLRGLLKKIVPERFNETIGLTHVKVYLFDDSFIISGANLSKDYFTNRQDRYILFNDCPCLADFFDDFVKSIMSISLTFDGLDSEPVVPDYSIHPYQGNKPKFIMTAREKLNKCLRIGERVDDTKLWRMKHENSTGSPDTFVYPLVQMGPFSITHDQQAMLQLLKQSSIHDQILLASGYFNLTDDYLRTILQESTAKYNILMASPQANGFLGARGAAGTIPYFYIHLARHFYKQMETYRQEDRIELVEYNRDKWTFHGKGLWYYLPNEALPSLTLVGSPNFGYRSVNRDLECEVAIVTKNHRLREQLRQEHVNMYATSSPVTSSTFERKDYKVATWIQLLSNYIKRFL